MALEIISLNGGWTGGAAAGAGAFFLVAAAAVPGAAVVGLAMALGSSRLVEGCKEGEDGETKLTVTTRSLFF